MYSYKRCACGIESKSRRMAVSVNRSVIRQLQISSVPSKAKILFILAKSSHCVCDLMTHTRLSQTLISHHLSDLTDVGLVRSKKSGAFVDYSLTPKGLRLIGAIKTLSP